MFLVAYSLGVLVLYACFIKAFHVEVSILSLKLGEHATSQNVESILSLCDLWDEATLDHLHHLLATPIFNFFEKYIEVREDASRIAILAELLEDPQKYHKYGSTLVNGWKILFNPQLLSSWRHPLVPRASPFRLRPFFRNLGENYASPLNVAAFTRFIQEFATVPRQFKGIQRDWDVFLMQNLPNEEVKRSFVSALGNSISPSLIHFAFRGRKLPPNTVYLLPGNVVDWTMVLRIFLHAPLLSKPLIEDLRQSCILQEHETFFLDQKLKSQDSARTIVALVEVIKNDQIMSPAEKAKVLSEYLVHLSPSPRLAVFILPLIDISLLSSELRASVVDSVDSLLRGRVTSPWLGPRRSHLNNPRTWAAPSFRLSADVESQFDFRNVFGRIDFRPPRLDIDRRFNTPPRPRPWISPFTFDDDSENGSDHDSMPDLVDAESIIEPDDEPAPIQLVNLFQRRNALIREQVTPPNRLILTDEDLSRSESSSRSREEGESASSSSSSSQSSSSERHSEHSWMIDSNQSPVNEAPNISFVTLEDIDEGDPVIDFAQLQEPSGPLEPFTAFDPFEGNPYLDSVPRPEIDEPVLPQLNDAELKRILEEQRERLLSADEIRDEQGKVLHCLHVFRTEKIRFEDYGLVPSAGTRRDITPDWTFFKNEIHSLDILASIVDVRGRHSIPGYHIHAQRAFQNMTQSIVEGHKIDLSSDQAINGLWSVLTTAYVFELKLDCRILLNRLALLMNASPIRLQSERKNIIHQLDKYFLEQFYMTFEEIVSVVHEIK